MELANIWIFNRENGSFFRTFVSVIIFIFWLATFSLFSTLWNEHEKIFQSKELSANKLDQAERGSDTKKGAEHEAH